MAKKPNPHVCNAIVNILIDYKTLGCNSAFSKAYFLTVVTNKTHVNGLFEAESFGEPYSPAKAMMQKGWKPGTINLLTKAGSLACPSTFSTKP